MHGAGPRRARDEGDVDRRAGHRREGHDRSDDHSDAPDDDQRDRRSEADQDRRLPAAGATSLLRATTRITLYVVEQRGTVQEVVDGQVLATPFLDITDRVQEVSERGLLGLAFPPDYATSGRFFVDYTDRVRKRQPQSGRVRALDEEPGSCRPRHGTPDPLDREAVGEPQRGHAAVRPRRLPLCRRRRRRLGRHQPTRGFRADARRPARRHPPNRSAPPDRDATRTRSRKRIPFVGKAAARGRGLGLRPPQPVAILDRPVHRRPVRRRRRRGRPQRRSTTSQGNRGGLNFGWPCFEGTVALPTTQIVRRPGRAGLRIRPRRRPLRGDRRRRRSRSPPTGSRRPLPLRRLLRREAAQHACRRRQGGRPSPTSASRFPTLDSFGVDGRGRVYVTATDGGVYRLDRVGVVPTLGSMAPAPTRDDVAPRARDARRPPPAHADPRLADALELTGAQVYLKAELFQRTGSFKPRGVLNKLASLTRRGEARAASSRGRPATPPRRSPTPPRSRASTAASSCGGRRTRARSRPRAATAPTSTSTPTTPPRPTSASSRYVERDRAHASSTRSTTRSLHRGARHGRARDRGGRARTSTWSSSRSAAAA